MPYELVGIIVKKIDYKESSNIIYVITEHGIKSVVIKGAKRYKGKYLGVSQVVTKVKLTVSKDSDISNIIDGDILNYYETIKSDIIAMNVAYSILENVYRLTNDDTDFKVLYHFIDIMFDRLNETNQPIDILVSFEWKALYLYGVNPQLKECVLCGKKEDIILFDSYHGGVLCSNCREEAKVTVNFALTQELIKIYFLKPEVGILEHSLEENKSLLQIIDDFYEHHLGYRSRSKKILYDLI